MTSGGFALVSTVSSTRWTIPAVSWTSSPCATGRTPTGKARCLTARCSGRTRVSRSVQRRTARDTRRAAERDRYAS